jgi:hypothetical protein
MKETTTIEAFVCTNMFWQVLILQETDAGLFPCRELVARWL